MNRRTFLGAAACAGLAASDRITVAQIGCGWQGGNNLKSFLRIPQARLVAVCDVDAEHLQAAKETVDSHYGDRGCAATSRFEELLLRPDIDAVSLALPDHWHGVVSLMALRNGKDVYGEKPLAHNFAEGRAIAEAAERFGRVWQTGSWQRSVAQFRQAAELVRNGRIGKVLRVEVGLPGGHTDFDKRGHEHQPGPPPKTLDYERWLGPAPPAPYSPARVHKTWRWNSDYGGGMLMDWVGHHVDIAHWGLGLDDTGPLEVQGQGEFERLHPVWDTVKRFRVTARYAGGLEMVISGGYAGVVLGTKWIGDAGWIWVDRAGIDASPRSLLQSRTGPDEVRLPVSPGHHEQFIGCVRSRGPTLSPARVALRSTTPGWLGVIAMTLGRKVRWDPEKMRIVGDPAAERMLSRPMRHPWRLDWNGS